MEAHLVLVNKLVIYFPYLIENRQYFTQCSYFIAQGASQTRDLRRGFQVNSESYYIALSTIADSFKLYSSTLFKLFNPNSSTTVYTKSYLKMNIISL